MAEGAYSDCHKKSSKTVSKQPRELTATRQKTFRNGTDLAAMRLAVRQRTACASPLLGSVRRMRVAALQLDVTHSMEHNIQRASSLIDEAAADGAAVVALPECFTGKYGVDHFAKWGESLVPEPDLGGGAAMMRERAAHHGIVVSGGVIEQREGCLFNTIAVYGPSGELALYRKVHLSRVLGITSESDVLTAGTMPTTFQVPQTSMRVGMLCCFDLRFRDLLAQYGPASGPHGPCDILCAPSAFLRATGTEHWDLVRLAGMLVPQAH
ncbi:MAG: hypothetical protein SGPRY_007280 [Prymnesium sp.]